MRKYSLIYLLALLAFTAFRTGRHTAPYRFPKLTYFPAMPRPAHAITQSGVALGRHLFYDPILSRDSTFSCASCHRQANAFSDATNKLSMGIDGSMQTRNTPALFNLAWQGQFFWDGRAKNIETQVFHPLINTHEMGGTWPVVLARLQNSKFYRRKFGEAFGDALIDSCLVATAIGQFERTLLSYRSKYDRVLNNKDAFTKDEAEGFELMNDMTKGDCLHCHSTDDNALGSTYAFSNNGLDAITDMNPFNDKGLGTFSGLETDNGKFKIPSVRNLVFTVPYMHDGRFSTLEEVLDFYSEGVKYSPNIDSKMGFVHQGGARLTKDEKRKIIAFLRTMSDSVFISDPEFSNPFDANKKK